MEERRRTAMIVTDHPAVRDAVHFTTESHRTIGQRIADAYQPLIEDPRCH